MGVFNFVESEFVVIEDYALPDAQLRRKMLNHAAGGQIAAGLKPRRADFRAYHAIWLRHRTLYFMLGATRTLSGGGDFVAFSMGVAALWAANRHFAGFMYSLLSDRHGFGHFP